MKKLVALLLCGALAFGLAACGDSTGASEGAAAEAAEAAEAAVEESSAAEETAAAASSAAASASAAEEAGEEGEEEAAPEVDESLVAADGINVCLASEPDTIDPALNSAVDGATLIVHLFSGLAKWEQDGEGYKIVPDCAEELVEPTDNGDGTITYTYTLRDGLKWSDGKDVTAGDFEFAWNRAASAELGADYGYMFEQVVGYDEISELKETGEVDDEGEPVMEPANPDAKLAVTAKDDKTLEVTVQAAAARVWNELIAFPTFFPVREDVVANESWATDPATYVSNGAYTMDSWQHNSVITLVKNENYVDAADVTMPAINFYLSDDANNMLTNFENGDWQLIDDVPTNEIASLKEEYPDEFQINGQMGTYYVGWNVNEDILPEGSGLEGAEAENARAEIRNAISLLYDRNYIVNDIAQGGQAPAASFVSSGLFEADGSDFSENAGHNDGYAGYYDVSEEAIESNYAAALEVLKKYYDFDEEKQQVTNFPTLTYLYNTSEGHKAIGEYLQMALASVGINMQLENQEWNTFLNTRKAGDYSVARNGWLCDYNDPMSMLDMWTTDSGNNDCQFGRDAHASAAVYSVDITDLGYDLKVENGTWAETYDQLISIAKSCEDNETYFELCHRAEDLLMSTGAICPLYFYTDLFMIDDSVEGFFSIPLGYKYFMYCTLK